MPVFEIGPDRCDTQKQISLSSDQGPGIVLAIDVPMIGLQLTGKETQPPQLNTRPHCFERVSQLSIAGAVYVEPLLFNTR